jgi:hypothetical protein
MIHVTYVLDVPACFHLRATMKDRRTIATFRSSTVVDPIQHE